MQTFLPYKSFKDSARCLDNKRLGKQRVEALQLLKTLKQGEWTCMNCHIPVTHFNPYKTGHHCYYCESPLKRTPWYNHPACKMWKGHERLLAIYAIWCIKEWTDRGYKDTCEEKINNLAIEFPMETTEHPSWLGNTEFHKSHQSNLLRKNSEHYEQFFQDVPSDLPYIWPTQ
jgi:hypothetical protein